MPEINIILFGLGFLSVCAAVILRERRTLLNILIAVALLFLVAPFVRQAYLTRDAYEWTVVAERTLGDAEEQRVIYVQRIEWITDYEVLKRQRGHVRSLVLDDETTRGEWTVKGYVPVQIRAEILYRSYEYVITRNYPDLEPGSYVFTLSFDEEDVGRWDVSLVESTPDGVRSE